MVVKVTKPEINVREKISELDKPSGVAGEAMLRAETPQEQFNLIGAGRRNILINGGFTVSQRGDYTTAASTSGGSYSLDRWNTDISGVTATIQNNTVDLPNGTEAKTAKLAATSSATGYLQLRQKIEVESWMQKRDVTLSAWVKSNSTYPRLRIEGAAVGSNEDGTQTHSGNGGWEFLTFTTTLADGFGAFHVGVVLWNGSTVSISSGDYIEIANVQLELGKVATPFEHRSYGEELALCQRYYWTDHLYGQGYQQANLDYSEIIQHPVEMRANPTRTLIGSLNYSSNLSALILASSPGTNGKNFTRAYGRATGNGYIEFGQAFSLDAEL